MATYKSVNKNTNVVSVGRTAPVPRGQRTSNESLPVVLASDAPPIPVEEQNKVASEVALSLLGIPRSEVALGIFADVNTYDVNPSEWSINPPDRRTFTGSTEASGIKKFIYEGSAYQNNNYNWGLTHVPEEAGAMIEAPPGETSILTSKRFFRYQPGRVSSATFGVKSSAPSDLLPDPACRNPAIRKYGIYDKFDGYYWETRQTGRGDEFSVTRRTQSIIDFRFNHTEFTTHSGVANDQITDYGIVGKGKEPNEVRESIMNSPIAYSDGTTIIIPNAYANLNQHFKDGVIPRIGMTLRNITVNTTNSPGFESAGVNGAGFVQDTDESPLFRESTVIISVDRVGDDLRIGLNNEPILGAVYENSISGQSSTNPASSGYNANGRLAGDFGPIALVTDVSLQYNFKRLKFTFAGENLLIRDNLPLIHGAMYDPSLLKPRIEYSIKGVTSDGIIEFPRPASASGKSGDEFITQGAIKYDDSPNGLYVQNVFSFGQLVEYTTDGDIGASAGNALLSSGTKNIFFISRIDALNNKIHLRNIASRSDSGSPSKPTFINTTGINTGGTKHFIKTPVPWLFPEVEYSGGDNFNVGDVMFPYTRKFSVFNPDITKPQSTLTGQTHRSDGQVGLLNTDLSDPSTGSQDSNLVEQYKSEINDINSGLSCCYMKGGRTYLSTESSAEDNNKDRKFYRKSSGWRYWIEQNVDPEYWGVYEYKVPRSRFSFDSLNGNGQEQIYYSDTVKDEGLVKYPGQPKSTGDLNRSSVWDIDFANVIMKKIEFSWYGAVGALFLAYVPDGVGEARWVRVHHLRCSNQLKTASLGNATLPLTYTVYGGGVPKQFGSNGDSGEAKLRSTNYSSGKSASEFVTKYGSSYYIDGGDRGTVRLFSYSQPSASKISSSKIADETIVDDDAGETLNKFRIDNLGRNREDLYIGSTIRFGTSQSTAIVTHVERAGLNNTPGTNCSTIYLNRAMTIDSPAIFLIKSPYTIFGITSKTNIQSSQDFLVRNRVQVYPTKLSVGMQTPGGQKANTTLTLQKNSVFQSDIVFDIYPDSPARVHKTIKFTGTTSDLELSGSGLPTRLTSLNVSPNFIDSANPTAGETNNGPYYNNAKIGDKLYGWSRVSDGVTDFTLFGRMEVVGLGANENSPIWDFISEDSYTGVVRFKEGSLFTHAYQYYNDLGSSNTGSSLYSGRLTAKLPSDSSTEIERLSSVRINNEIRRPIPNTGTSVATFYLEDGSDYFDLQAYFDYNKDYISFPLTNIPDNLYIGAQYNEDLEPIGSGNAESPRIAVSLTWEEQ